MTKMHPVYDVNDTVTFSASATSTLNGAPVTVTISVKASDELEHYIDRPVVGKLPAAFVEMLHILGVIHDGKEPDIQIARGV